MATFITMAGHNSSYEHTAGLSRDGRYIVLSWPCGDSYHFTRPGFKKLIKAVTEAKGDDWILVKDSDKFPLCFAQTKGKRIHVRTDHDHTAWEIPLKQFLKAYERVA